MNNADAKRSSGEVQEPAYEVLAIIDSRPMQGNASGAWEFLVVWKVRSTHFGLACL